MILSFEGGWVAGANPSCYWLEGELHHGKVSGLTYNHSHSHLRALWSHELTWLHVFGGETKILRTCKKPPAAGLESNQQSFSCEGAGLTTPLLCCTGNWSICLYSPISITSHKVAISGFTMCKTASVLKPPDGRDLQKKKNSERNRRNANDSSSSSDSETIVDLWLY